MKIKIKIKKMMSCLLAVLFLCGSISVSHAEVFDVSYYIDRINEREFPPLDYEDDMINLSEPPIHNTQLLWIKEVIFPKPDCHVDIRKCAKGKSNTTKFLLIYKKIWPMCMLFLNNQSGDEIKDDFVRYALEMYSTASRKRWGDKWGIVAVLWSVYHAIPCIRHEIDFVIGKSSDCKEVILNLENFCLAYYQLACDQERYTGMGLERLKDTLEFNRMLF